MAKEKKRKKKIPENYTWFEVCHPRIPTQTGCYRVAALHEDEATTIISKKFKIGIYVDDENTEIKKIGPVNKPKTRENKKESDQAIQNPLDVKLAKLEEKEGPIEEKICPNCGCKDKSIGSDSCPSCQQGYPQNYYSIPEETTKIRGSW